MKTTQVPTEWLEELRNITKKLIEDVGHNREYGSIEKILNLSTHIYATKYFAFHPQPEQPISEADLEEFAMWWFDSIYRFIEGSFVDGISKAKVPFSEVYEAFKKSKA